MGRAGCSKQLPLYPQAILNEPTGVSERAKVLKLRINPTNKAYSDDVDMQALATYKKYRVVLYNNLFENVKTFIPGYGQSTRVKYGKRDDIEILHHDFNHYQALLRRKDINEWDMDVKTEEKKVCTKINKRVTLKPFDDKFVSWDLECSPNGTADGVHKCYAAGFSWKENGDLKNISFWGLDAITNSLDFLYANR